MPHTESQIRKTALVTGASSGIGLELARLFAQDGYNLVLVARSEDKLTVLAKELTEKHGITALVLAKDLADPASPEAIFAETRVQKVHIDVLVNNAGFATYGFFAETDLATELQELQVNIVALTHLTKLYLRSMLENGSGRIMNVASTAAFQPGPLMALYYATKAYVLSFSQALANEVKGTGVTVTALCPGATTSGFQERANMGGSRLVHLMRFMDATTVARIGYRGLMRGKPVVITGFLNKLLVQSVRFTPRRLLVAFVRLIQDKRK